MRAENQPKRDDWVEPLEPMKCCWCDEWCRLVVPQSEDEDERFICDECGEIFMTTEMMNKYRRRLGYGRK